MDPEPVSVSERLQSATSELRDVEAMLKASADFDARILSDFRDAVNRVRTSAWAVQQYAESACTEQNPSTVLSLLAGERVRAAYQLCRALQQDLKKTDLHFQPGQLIQLQTAVQELLRQLNSLIGKSV